MSKVDPSGTTTRIAGGCCGGDGQPAITNTLMSPSGVAVSPTGEVYIAEAGACRIRRVDRNGIISTVAGTGTRGFSGDGDAAMAARLDVPVQIELSGSWVYVADSFNGRVRRFKV